MVHRMNQWIRIALLALGVHAWPGFAADAVDEEQTLINILQSSSVGPREKDAACARLKLIGTDRSVPAVAALLGDAQLSHSARYALEPMESSAAGQALIDGLDHTRGEPRIGLVNSLASRRETEAVPVLAPLLKDPDAGVAEAAAHALGEIGAPEGVSALRACARESSRALHAAAVDGLLRAASRMLVSGQRSMALAVYEQLDQDGEADWVRVAAFRGRVLGSGNAGLYLVLHALSGPAGPSQVAALQLARQLPVAHAARELSRLVPALAPPVQFALLGSLAQRSDPSALPALRRFAPAAAVETRVALAQAFDSFGDASLVPLLADWAASGAPELQTAARRALADLDRGNVTGALIGQLKTSSPAVQAELARALGARRNKAAVPQLMALARQQAGPGRQGALQALSVLADERDLHGLVALVLDAEDPTARAEAAGAVNAAYRHLLAERGRAEVGPLVEAVEKGSELARQALLPVCAGLVDVEVRRVLRAAVHDPSAAVRSAAARAVCDTVDGELLPDLLELARAGGEPAIRALAIRGTVRLVTQEEKVKLSPAQRVAALKLLLACAPQTGEKRRVLAGLGELADPEALELIRATLADPTVRNEAAQAAVKVASALPANQALAAEAALKQALAVVDDDGTRRDVQAALERVQANSTSAPRRTPPLRR